MTAGGHGSAAPRRVGVVLGAGGTLGAAWMVGVLSALQERLAGPLGEVDLMLGTSAGSVLTAALRAGIPVTDLVAHQAGAATDLPSLHAIDRDTRPVPPRLRLGSPHLLARATLAPHQVHPRVAATGLVPEGRGQLDSLGTFVAEVQRRSGRHPAGWPDRPTWIVAVDYRSGRRTVFGRPGTPTVSLGDAVEASCSIPGWYQPKTIDRQRYVDGGVHSVASVDLLAGAKLDQVFVLAPMAGHHHDRPTGALPRAERFLRICVTGWVDAEAARVRATGTEVTVITPGPDDLGAMGINLMDSSRRHAVLRTALRTAPQRIAMAATGRSAR
jgi:NTE family protein